MPLSRDEIALKWFWTLEVFAVEAVREIPEPWRGRLLMVLAGIDADRWARCPRCCEQVEPGGTCEDCRLPGHMEPPDDAETMRAELLHMLYGPEGGGS